MSAFCWLTSARPSVLTFTILCLSLAPGPRAVGASPEGWVPDPLPMPEEWIEEPIHGEGAKQGEIAGALEAPRPYRYTPADVQAAMRHASPRTQCIIRAEVGGRGYDPYAIGRAGERGPAQLHPRGLLPLYLRWSNGALPENPYVAIPFVDWAIGQGYARQWSPVLAGRC